MSNNYTIDLTTAQTLNIIAQRGDTFSKTYNISASSGSIDLSTISSAEMMIKHRKTDCFYVLYLNTSDGSISFNTNANTVTLYVSASDMQNVQAGRYVYDFKIITTDATEKTYLQGYFTIMNNVTRLS